MSPTLKHCIPQVTLWPCPTLPNPNNPTFDNLTLLPLPVNHLLSILTRGVQIIPLYDKQGLMGRHTHV